MAELGQVHRHELSGALHGLMRVRSFVQDDAHLFMTFDQIQDEIVGVIQLADYFYKTFGFEYSVELSTKPEKAMGSDEDWEKATDALRNALEVTEIDYVLNPGDGAFYGPKIDFHLRDSIGRTWQCGTIQLDFQMPERFDLHYVGSDNAKHRPVVIHRTVLGSIERFMGILIEHFAGKFPLWLSPVQVQLITVSDAYNDFAQELAEKFIEKGIRVNIDDRVEKIGYKIREAQLLQIPYMLVIGEKEMTNQILTVRNRDTAAQNEYTVDEFLNKLTTNIENRTLELF